MIDKKEIEKAVTKRLEKETDIYDKSTDLNILISKEEDGNLIVSLEKTKLMRRLKVKVVCNLGKDINKESIHSSINFYGSMNYLNYMVRTKKGRTELNRKMAKFIADTIENKTGKII